MTSIVSIVELSDVFLMIIFPVSTSTGSEKLSSILLLTATPVELSAGDELLKVGLTVSTVVNETVYAGSHSFVWNAGGLTSGLYVMSVTYDGNTYNQKVTLVK